MRLPGISRRAFFTHGLATLWGSLAGAATGSVACNLTWEKPVIDKEIKDAIKRLESYGYRINATIVDENKKLDLSHAYQDIGNPVASGVVGSNIGLPIARIANRRESEKTKNKGPEHFEGKALPQPIERRYFLAAVASGALVGVPIGYGTEIFKVPTPQEQKEIDKLVKLLTEHGYKVLSPSTFRGRHTASVIASTAAATVAYVTSRVIHSQKIVDELDKQDEIGRILDAKRNARRSLDRDLNN